MVGGGMDKEEVSEENEEADRLSQILCSAASSTPHNLGRWRKRVDRLKDGALTLWLHTFRLRLSADLFRLQRSTAAQTPAGNGRARGRAEAGHLCRPREMACEAREGAGGVKQSCSAVGGLQKPTWTKREEAERREGDQSCGSLAEELDSLESLAPSVQPRVLRRCRDLQEARLSLSGSPRRPPPFQQLRLCLGCPSSPSFARSEASWFTAWVLHNLTLWPAFRL